jgi:uncharacterized coiled-coil DUF342 family protein
VKVHLRSRRFGRIPHQIKPLADQCRAVHKDMGNPKSLRDAVRELVDMARRSSEQLDGLEFSVRKEMMVLDHGSIKMPALEHLLLRY